GVQVIDPGSYINYGLPFNPSGVVNLTRPAAAGATFNVHSIGAGINYATVAPGLLAPGIGYQVGEQVTVQGGTVAPDGVVAVLEITSVNLLGGVTGVKIIRSGKYTTLPANPVSVLGNGLGAR